MTLERFVLVFFAALFMDSLWALYILHVAKKKYFSSACLSVLLIFLSFLTVISYVEEHQYLIPTAGGAFVGTFLTILIDLKIEVASKNKSISKKLASYNAKKKHESRQK